MFLGGGGVLHACTPPPAPSHGAAVAHRLYYPCLEAPLLAALRRSVEMLLHFPLGALGLGTLER